MDKLLELHEQLREVEAEIKKQASLAEEMRHDDRFDPDHWKVYTDTIIRPLQAKRSEIINTVHDITGEKMPDITVQANLGIIAAKGFNIYGSR